MIYLEDYDPELQKILDKKRAAIQTKSKFFELIETEGVTEVKDDSIEKIIQESPLPVIVDFSADDWCRPCQVVAPIFKALSLDYKGKMVFLKINTDHNQKAAGRYRVMSVPTFVIFNKNDQIIRKSGAMNKNDFAKWIDKALDHLKNKA